MLYTPIILFSGSCGAMSIIASHTHVKVPTVKASESLVPGVCCSYNRPHTASMARPNRDREAAVLGRSTLARCGQEVLVVDVEPTSNLQRLRGHSTRPSQSS